ncbi:hypothetical protein B7494_g2828 [Chlorociboria aeruginascens]|nr:hypothetical protein B7494_g2828 [Chlorociboria aeruginascens]
MSGSLFIRDSRTGRDYQVPVEDNVIRMSHLAQINGPQESENGPSKDTGLIVLDVAAERTAVIETAIGYADGEASVPILAFRGYRVEQLAKQYNYEEASHLLIFDSVPSSAQRDSWRRSIALASASIPDAVVTCFKALPRSTPQYSLILTGLAACLSMQPQTIPAQKGRNLYLGNREAVDTAIPRILGTFSRIVALAHCHTVGQNAVDPDPNGSYISNTFRMMGIATDPQTGEPDPAIVKLVGRAWVFGIDHGLTASAATLMNTASTLADPISVVISTLAAAYGVLHFGAAESAYRLMQSLGTPDKVPAAIEQVKRGKMRLMGVGHRVYKRADPRLAETKRIIEGLRQQGKCDPLLAVAQEIERCVTADAWFARKGLIVNIDLYWMFIYTALEIPLGVILPLFMTGRMAGYMAHWREMMLSKKNHKLWRPRELYIGKPVDMGRTPASLEGEDNRSIKRKVPTCISPPLLLSLSPPLLPVLIVLVMILGEPKGAIYETIPTYAPTPTPYITHNLKKFFRKLGIKGVGVENLKKGAMAHLEGRNAMDALNEPTKRATRDQTQHGGHDPTSYEISSQIQALEREKQNLQRGPGSVQGPHYVGSVSLRIEIRDLQNNYPDQWNLYLLALDAFYKLDEKSDLSFYGIAGIHGRPYRPWGGVQGNNPNGWQGYCTHTSILFAPWHRPYIALYEQVLVGIVQKIASSFPDATRARYVEAASTFRVPYWDWAAVPAANDYFPLSVGQSATVNVITPQSNGKKVSMNNPLYTYHFSPLNPVSGDFPVSPNNHWPTTLRYPTSSSSNAKSQDQEVFKAMASQFESFQSNVNLLMNDPNYTDFAAFSNHQWARSNAPGAYGSLEDVHNSIHGEVGGNGGQMADTDYAGFDPVFWLHHVNVDRLFAIWQALNPDSYTINKPSGDGTFVIAANSTETGFTPLAPFNDASGRQYYTSEGVRSTEKFNYAYPETQRWKFGSDDEYKNSIRATVQQLYGGVSNQFLGDQNTNLFAAPVQVPSVPMKVSGNGSAGDAPATLPTSLQDTVPEGSFALDRGIDLEAEIAKSSTLAIPPQKEIKYNEYIVNILAPKHILSQTYRVHIFLGPFDPSTPTWHTQDALVGTFVALGKNPHTTGCGKCKSDAEANVMVTGTIPLTSALLKEYKNGNVGSLEKENVLAYLREHLHWRVTTADGNDHPREQIPGLKVSVILKFGIKKLKGNSIVSIKALLISTIQNIHLAEVMVGLPYFEPDADTLLKYHLFRIIQFPELKHFSQIWTVSKLRDVFPTSWPDVYRPTSNMTEASHMDYLRNVCHTEYMEECVARIRNQRHSEDEIIRLGATPTPTAPDRRRYTSPTSPNPASLRIRKCNCSTCHKMSIFHVRPPFPPDDFLLLSPAEPFSQLGDYSCAAGNIHWFFCPKCAVRCFAFMGQGERRVVDLSQVDFYTDDGKGQGGKVKGKGGKETEVWAPMKEGWTGEVHRGSYLTLNAATLEPGQEGADLREWHEKGYVVYLDCLDSKFENRLRVPYQGGMY